MLMENQILLSDKSFEKKLKMRMYYSVILLVLGAVSIVLGLVYPIQTLNHDFSSGFYTGVGSGLIFGALLNLYRQRKVLKNPELFRERAIFESDERNKLIGMKTWSYAGWLMFVILYIALLVTGLFNTLISVTIMTTIGVYALCIIGVGIYLKKTM